MTTLNDAEYCGWMDVTKISWIYPIYNMMVVKPVETRFSFGDIVPRISAPESPRLIPFEIEIDF